MTTSERSRPDVRRKPAPGGKRPQGKRKNQRQQTIFYAAAAVGAAVVLLAVLAVVMVAGKDDPERGPVAEALVPMGRPARSGTAPASYSSSPSTEAFTEIETRAADPKPLTAAEMFPDKTLPDEVAKAEPAKRAVKLDGDCAKAMWGSALGAVLRGGGCSQAVRALYADDKKGVSVTLAVFNLKDAASADRAVEAFGAGTGGFVRPLPDRSKKAVRFGEGFGIARGLALGHYALITWVQRADGTGDERSRQLLSLLVTAAKAEAIYLRAAG